MSYRQMKRILPLYAKIQLSLRQILISILKMKARVCTYECNFALGSFFWGGGQGAENQLHVWIGATQMGILEPFWSGNGC